MDALISLCKAPKGSRDLNELRLRFNSLVEDIFSPPKDGGRYNVEFAKTWKNRFIKVFGADGSTLFDMPLAELGTSKLSFDAVEYRKMQADMKDAIKPSLMQTLEGTLTPRGK